MSKPFGPPVKIELAKEDGTIIDGVKNIYFSELHAESPTGIYIKGRKNNPVTNISFSSCSFAHIDYSAFGDRFFHGGQSKAKSHGVSPHLEFYDNIRFCNVEFKTKQ